MSNTVNGVFGISQQNNQQPETHQTAGTISGTKSDTLKVLSGGDFKNKLINPDNIDKQVSNSELNEKLDRIKNHILNLIKDKRTAATYYEAIKSVILSYDNPNEASLILAEYFGKYVVYDFNEEKFKKFIRSIDPRVVFENDINHAFYGDYDVCEQKCKLDCENEAGGETCEKQFILNKIWF